MMRRISLSIILMLLWTFSVFAAPSRVTIGVGNDFFSYGFSRNDDDQLSYSERLGFSSDRWGVELNLDSITNRGWKDDWDFINEKKGTDSTDWYSGRYDSLKLVGSYKFNFDVTDTVSFKLKPEIGLALVGNLGTEYFQNWIHTVRKIHDVELSYDDSSVKLKTIFGGEAIFSYDFFKFENNTVRFSAKTKISVTQKFRGEEYFGAEVSLENPDFIPVSINLGYSLNQSFSDNRTEKLFSRHMNGFRFGFSIDTGFIVIDYLSPVESAFGFGTVSFDIMSFLRENNWKETDMILRFGAKACVDDIYTLVGLETKLNDNWFILFDDSTIASQPVSNEDELASDFSKDPRLKKNNSIFTIGLKHYFKIKEAKDWVIPYLSSSVGFARWNQVELSNTIATSVYPEQDKYDYLSLLADLTMGVKLIPNGLLVSDITTFSLNVFAGVMHIPGLEKDFPMKNTSSVSPVLGICIDAGIDV